MRVDEGGPIGPLEAAAVLAALTRYAEEQAVAAGVAPEPPRPSRWVMSGRPRPFTPPFSTRVAPDAEGWGLEDDEAGEASTPA